MTGRRPLGDSHVPGTCVPRTAQGRRLWRLALSGLGAFSALSDLLPAQWRYGYVRPLARKVLGVPRLRALDGAGAAPGTKAAVEAAPSAPLAVLLTGRLDVGGVEAVVETLARGLPGHGLRTAVLCQAGGRTADRLLAAGIPVLEAPNRTRTSELLGRLDPSVIQLHSPPPALREAAFASGVPVVPVLHNTEVHHTPADWLAARRSSERAHATIAVSALVRDYHERHLPGGPVSPIVVVPNAAGQALVTGVPDRQSARERLRTVAGPGEPDEVVLLCMARFDAQKNLPATVRAFLDAVEGLERPARLVVAGDPSDAAEAWRVEAVRRAHPRGAQVTLLANSDAATLLAAADAFVLTSFFEGWPVAATEAATLGLPLLMTEVGGAAEIMGEGSSGGQLVANPAGSATEVSIATIRSARRRLTQQNHQEVAAALRLLVGRLPEPAPARDSRAQANRQRFSSDVMLAGHAAVLLGAAGTERLRPGG